MNRIPPHLPAAALLAIYWWMAVSAAATKSMTSDEIYHITAGYSFWTQNEYRLGAVNGNLPGRWQSLPLALGRYAFPPRDLGPWRESNTLQVGLKFFFDSANDADAMLRQARAMAALMTAMMGLLIYCWSARLFGIAGGLVSLALFAFCPLMLSHGALATSDAPASFFMLASIGALWAAMRRFTLGHAALACASVSLLFVSKHTAMLLIPMALVMAGIRIAIDRRWGTLRNLGLLAAAMSLSVWVTIWAFFGFQYSALGAAGELRGDTLFPGWSLVLGDGGWAVAAIQTARQWCLLPEIYLYDLANTLHFSNARQAFLNGDYRTTGWWWYFPCAMLIKTPPAIWAAWIAAVAAIVWRCDRKLILALTPIGVLIVIYTLIALTSHINTGVRHMLPVYAALHVLAGGAAILLRNKFTAALLGALLFWAAADSLLIRPDYLAYFNPIAGGSKNGYHHLVDSNVDWGQDLLPLSRWLKEHPPAVPFYLSYFGNVPLRHYNIQARLLHSFPEDPRGVGLQGRVTGDELEPGIYCISVNLFQGVFHPILGRWTPKMEAVYQRLLPTIRRLHELRGNPDRWRALRQTIADEDFRYITLLREIRLYAHLRKRPPDDRVGFSFLVYRVTGADLDQAQDGPPPELLTHLHEQ